MGWRIWILDGEEEGLRGRWLMLMLNRESERGGRLVPVDRGRVGRFFSESWRAVGGAMR